MPHPIIGELNEAPIISIQGAVTPGVTPDEWTVLIDIDSADSEALFETPSSTPSELRMFDSGGAGDDLLFEEMYVVNVQKKEELVNGTGTAVVEVKLHDRRTLLKLDDFVGLFEINIPEESGDVFTVFSVPDPSTPEIGHTFKTAITFLMEFHLRGPEKSSSANPLPVSFTSLSDTQDLLVPSRTFETTLPAKVMQELLDISGFALWPLPSGVFVFIDQKDVDVPTFLDAEIHRLRTVSFPIVRPDRIRVIGARKVFQMSIPLVAVAEDLNKEVKVLDDLSYKPIEGFGPSWGARKFSNLEVPETSVLEALGLTADQIAGLTAETIRSIARHQVFRWWQIPETFETMLTTEDQSGIKTFTVSRDLLPMLGKIARLETRGTGNERQRLKAPFVQASYTAKSDKDGGGHVNIVPPRPVASTFDQRRGIFKASRALVIISDPAKAALAQFTDAEVDWEASPVLGIFAMSGDPRILETIDDFVTVVSLLGPFANRYAFEFEFATSDFTRITFDVQSTLSPSERIHTIRDENLQLRLIDGLEQNGDELDALASDIIDSQIPPDETRIKGAAIIIGAKAYGPLLTGAVKDISFEMGDGGLSTHFKLNDNRPPQLRKSGRQRDHESRVASDALGTRQQMVLASVQTSLGCASDGVGSTDFGGPAAVAGAHASDTSPPIGGAGSASPSGAGSEGGERQILNRDHFGVIMLPTFDSFGAGADSDDVCFAKLKGKIVLSGASGDGHNHILGNFGAPNLCVFFSALGEDEDVWFIRGYRYCKIFSGSSPTYTVIETDIDGVSRLGGTSIPDCTWSIGLALQEAVDTVYNAVADLHGFGTIETELDVDDRVVLVFDHKGNKILIGHTSVPGFSA